MASMSQVQGCSSHELGGMASASSTTVIDIVQAPSVEPSSVNSTENGTPGAQIPDTSVAGAQEATAARWWLDVGYLNTLLREMWYGTSSLRTSLGSSFFSRTGFNFCACLICMARDGRQAKTVSWSKIIAFAACLTTIVTLWPTHQSAVDGSRSLALSQWTANKDYFLFCEEHDWMTPDCLAFRDTPPGPPPKVGVRGLRKTTHSFNAVSDLSAIDIAVGMTVAACLLVLARRRRILPPRRLGRHVLRLLQRGTGTTSEQPQQEVLQLPIPEASQRVLGVSSGFSSGLSRELPAPLTPSTLRRMDTHGQNVLQVLRRRMKSVAESSATFFPKIDLDMSITFIKDPTGLNLIDALE